MANESDHRSPILPSEMARDEAGALLNAFGIARTEKDFRQLGASARSLMNDLDRRVAEASLEHLHRALFKGLIDACSVAADGLLSGEQASRSGARAVVGATISTFDCIYDELDRPGIAGNLDSCPNCHSPHLFSKVTASGDWAECPDCGWTGEPTSMPTTSEAR